MRGSAEAQTYSVFNIFGRSRTALTTEEAINASAHERIVSIWPFIVSKVITFSQSLRDRERANYDPEDVCLDLYVELSTKNDAWAPERGKYITFAGKIVRNRLYAIRDLSRVVHSPRNSSLRAKDYESREQDGTLTDGQADTLRQIRQSIAETQEVKHDCRLTESEPADVVAQAEALALRNRAVLEAIGHLDPYEAVVIGRAFGLWEREPMTTQEIARSTGRSHAQVAFTKSQAYKKIRQLMTAAHPDAIPGIGE